MMPLLQLTLHDECRAWKEQDFEVMDRLCEKEYIRDPANKYKSVALTEDGLKNSRELFMAMFDK